MAKFVTFKPVESEKLNKSEPVLKYKLLTSKAYPPTRETAGSIGYDLKSPRFARIPPRGGTYYLPLGIAFQIPEGHYGRLAPKSGLAIYRSIGVLAGVIDQDYTGEVFVLLINHDDIKLLVAEAACATSAYLSSVLLLEQLKLLKLSTSRVEHTS